MSVEIKPRSEQLSVVDYDALKYKFREDLISIPFILSLEVRIVLTHSYIENILDSSGTVTMFFVAAKFVTVKIYFFV